VFARDGNLNPGAPVRNQLVYSQRARVKRAGCSSGSMDCGHYDADSLFDRGEVLFVNMPVGEDLYGDGGPIWLRFTVDPREEEMPETREDGSHLFSQERVRFAPRYRAPYFDEVPDGWEHPVEQPDGVSGARRPRVRMPGVWQGGAASVSVGDARDLGLGVRFAEVGSGGRHSPARPGPGSMSPGFRLRRHGRLTNQMEKAAAEALDPLFTSGGQTSSGIVGTWIRLIQEAKGVKLARGERVLWWREEPEGEKPGKVGEDWMIELIADGRTLLVSLVAYTSLASYVCFRPRTAELVPALRTRAIQKLRDIDYPEHLSGLVVGGTVAFAMQVLPSEIRAWDSMGGEAGWRSGRASGWVSSRTVPETHVKTGFRVANVWDRMCVAIVGGKTSRGRVLPRAGP
jgi:hypothetical protein